jgi:hypothetical protein
MYKVKQLGAIVLTVCALLSHAYAGPVSKPPSPQVSIGGLRLTPEEVLSLSVTGPTFSRNFVWTEEEAERQKGPNSEKDISRYPNKLLGLYTDKGFLVIKWNRWKSPTRPYDEKHVDVYTMINLSQIVYLNVNDYGTGKYHLRIKLAKGE